MMLFFLFASHKPLAVDIAGPGREKPAFEQCPERALPKGSRGRASYEYQRDLLLRPSLKK
jgi:hypothetical protein